MRSTRALFTVALAAGSACNMPTEFQLPVAAVVELAASTISVGDSVAFSVTWSNRTGERIELVYPVTYDVRLVRPDGSSETLRADRPTIDILTPELVLDGGRSRTWRGYWYAAAGRGVYRVEAVRRVGDGPFERIGQTRSFAAE